MTRDRSTGYRTAIDDYLDTTVESSAGDLALARATVDECADRWYGRLLLLVHGSVDESRDVAKAVPAAAAIELFRGYCRLRERTLLGAGDYDATSALLASDYLFTSAYATLGALETEEELLACFDLFTTASNTVVEAFGSNYLESRSPTTDRSFVDATAGTLGRTAARIGATLADVEASQTRFETLGRGVAVARGVSLVLTDAAHPGPPPADEPPLRRHADRRLAEAERALQGLSETVNVAPLRSFVEDVSTRLRVD